MLITLLTRFLEKVGRSVAETQRTLDLNFIKTQIEIDEKKALSEYEIQAAWHHIPEVFRFRESLKWFWGLKDKLK